jgi:peptidoglycan hydrolase-like protein with peptidoglycan-binding domain
MAEYATSARLKALVAVGAIFIGVPMLLGTYISSTQSPNPTANFFRPDEPAKQAAAPPKDVAIIQARLIELGYLSGPADGVWGAKSRAGLRAFKGAHDLDSDERSIWNDTVSKRLFSKNAVRAPLPLAKAQ